MSQPGKAKAGVRLRQAMVAALGRVLDQGWSLDRALAQQGEQVAASDRSMLVEVCYGVLRWHRLLEAVLAKALRKPLRERDLHLLLLAGAYQMLYLRVPDYAVVDSAVACARASGKPWAAGLVNGVLRNLARQRETWLAPLQQRPELRWATPDWMLDEWCRDWGEAAAERLAEAACQRPPMWLRVDLARGGREAVLDRFRTAGIGAEAPLAPASALRLEQPCPVETLPGFAEGRVSVQDAAAQFAAPLLDLRAGQRVLDACAAPGGKTLHLLETQPELAELVALDRDEARLRRVDENLRRCGRQAHLLAADAGDPAAWWDGRPFDRILLDAPCSGSGVIRRHPDIKHLRRPQDLETLAAQQARLLDALWLSLAAGGMLLYVTCSIFRRENELQMLEFVRRHQEAEVLQPELPVGRRSGPGWQILTGEAGMDGFFYCLLGKKPGG